jgi:hypothetical protein
MFAAYSYLVEWPVMLAICALYLGAIAVGRAVMTARGSPITLPGIIPIIYNVVQVDHKRSLNRTHTTRCP